MIAGQEVMERTNFLLKVNQQRQLQYRHVWVYFSTVKSIIQFLQILLYQNSAQTAADHSLRNNDVYCIVRLIRLIFWLLSSSK
jgi:hypothetical protein